MRKLPTSQKSSADDIVKTIRESKRYTEKALQYAFNHLHINDDSGTIRKSLEYRGLTFLPSIDWCAPERIKELEKNLEKYASQNPQLQQQITFQFGFAFRL